MIKKLFLESPIEPSFKIINKGNEKKQEKRKLNNLELPPLKSIFLSTRNELCKSVDYRKKDFSFCISSKKIKTENSNFINEINYLEKEKVKG